MRSSTMLTYLLVLAALGCSGTTSSSSSSSGSTTGPSDAGGNQPDAAIEPDAGTLGAFGDPCQVDVAGQCGDSLLCLAGPSGGTVGFCTQTCTGSGACPNAPAGTAAYCVVTGVDAMGHKGCAFLCAGNGSTWTCPGQLTCAATDEPPGSGQRLCLP